MYSFLGCSAPGGCGVWLWRTRVDGSVSYRSLIHCSSSRHKLYVWKKLRCLYGKSVLVSALLVHHLLMRVVIPRSMSPVQNPWGQACFRI